MKNLLQK